MEEKMTFEQANSQLDDTVRKLEDESLSVREFLFFCEGIKKFINRRFMNKLSIFIYTEKLI